MFVSISISIIFKDHELNDVAMASSTSAITEIGEYSDMPNVDIIDEAYPAIDDTGVYTAPPSEINSLYGPPPQELL